MPAHRGAVQRVLSTHVEVIRGRVDHDDVGCLALARFVLTIPALVPNRPRSPRRRRHDLRHARPRMATTEALTGTLSGRASRSTVHRGATADSRR